MHETPYVFAGEESLFYNHHRSIVFWGQEVRFCSLLIQCLTQLVLDPCLLALQCYSNQKMNNRMGC